MTVMMIMMITMMCRPYIVGLQYIWIAPDKDGNKDGDDHYHDNDNDNYEEKMTMMMTMLGMK